MPTEDDRRFDEIAARLLSDSPRLSHVPGTPWPRPVRVTAACVGGVVWALLSVAMVAWGMAGVVLTVAVVLVTAAGAMVAQRRRRSVPDPLRAANTSDVP